MSVWKPRRPAVVRAVQQAMRDLCGRSREFCLRNCAVGRHATPEDRARLIDSASYYLAHNAMRYAEWRANPEVQAAAAKQIARYIDGDLCPKE